MSNLKTKKVLIVISLILCFISVFAVYNFEVFQARIMRLITSSIFLALFIFFKVYEKSSMLLVFLFFWLSDIFIVNYEYPFFSELFIISSTIPILLISKNIYSKAPTLKLKKPIIFLFACIVLLNIYMIYDIANVVDTESMRITEKGLIYINGFSLLLAATLAGSYNINQYSKQSFYCVVFVFLFILTAICNALSYYLDIKILFYFDRCLYTLALLFLFMYSLAPLDKADDFDMV